MAWQTKVSRKVCKFATEAALFAPLTASLALELEVGQPGVNKEGETHPKRVRSVVRAYQSRRCTCTSEAPERSQHKSTSLRSSEPTWQGCWRPSHRRRHRTPGRSRTSKQQSQQRRPSRTCERTGTTVSVRTSTEKRRIRAHQGWTFPKNSSSPSHKVRVAAEPASEVPRGMCLLRPIAWIVAEEETQRSLS